MNWKRFSPWLARLLQYGGWFLVAPVLAGFVWVLLEAFAPVPQGAAPVTQHSPPALVWVSDLDRHWQPAAQAPVVEAPRSIEPSRLRVEVQGGVFSSQPGRSVVLLRYRNQNLTLSEGDELEEGLRLTEIQADALIFSRGGQLERVEFELDQEVPPSQRLTSLLDQEANEQPQRRSRQATRPSRAASRDTSSERSQAPESTADAAQAIRHQERVGTRPLEETFGPDFRESLVRDPLQLMRHITLSPHNEGGQLQGFRIRPGSDPALFNSLGLQAGDLVVAVDGQAVSDTSAMMQLHGQLASARSLDVEILRDGERLLFSLEME